LGVGSACQCHVKLKVSHALKMTGDGLCHASLTLEYGLYMLPDLFGVRAQLLNQISRA
jgi:hypothetical protein